MFFHNPSMFRFLLSFISIKSLTYGVFGSVDPVSLVEDESNRYDSTGVWKPTSLTRYCPGNLWGPGGASNVAVQAGDTVESKLKYMNFVMSWRFILESFWWWSAPFFQTAKYIHWGRSLFLACLCIV